MGDVKRHVLISSSRKSITCNPIPLILILANSISLIGCIEVMYRVYCKKCKIGKYQSLPLDSKFSLYIAITNGLFVSMQIIEMMLTGTQLMKPGMTCDVIGKISPSLLTLNLLLVISFTYLIYLKVCKNIDMNDKTGKYDWKLWKLLLLFSLVASVFGLNKYVPQSLWCSNQQPQGRAMYLANIGFIISALIPTLKIYFELVSTKRENRIVEKDVPIHPQIVRNAASYLLVFFLQWICVLVYNFAMLYENNDLPMKNVYIATVLILGVNFGGLGNALVYIINDYRTNIVEDSNSLMSSPHSKSYGTLP